MSNSHIVSRLLVPVATLLLFATNLLSQSAAAAPLFEDSTPLEITLRGPFEQIDRERDKEQEYPGTLSYTDPDAGPTTLDLKFSVRGNFRLRKDICSNSQLWVNLKKSQLDDTLFDKQNKLKLVVRCKNADRFEEYIAKEQQLYSIFQELSEKSLATRLLRVTYIDSESGDTREQMAFFIQHHDRLAKQLGMQEFEETRADKDRLDVAQSSLVAVFMYFVSNTDYSFIAADPGDTCCHNIKLFEADDGTLTPIPYDYDSSGYVNPPYAEPSGGIGQRSVTQRMYRGYCAPEDTVMAAVQRFQDKREQIEAIASDETYVDARTAKRTAKFVDKFYKVIDNPKKLRREILEDCR